MESAYEPNSKIGSSSDFRDESNFVSDWFLMGSPVPVSLIVASYLLFVLKLGPEFMKNRKPYKLQTVLLLYNIGQVCMSSYMFLMSIGILSKHGFLPPTCIAETPAGLNMMASGIYIFFSAKLSELLDTVFFVFRKKDNQVSFLHVYHHTIVVVATWIALKYDPSYLLVFLGMLNSFVHVVMYTYYGLAAFPSLKKFLWWKKYITSIQIIQFVFILFHYALTYKTTQCTPSTFVSVVYMVNLSLFIYLFGKFYVNNYLKNRKTVNSDAAGLKQHTNNNEKPSNYKIKYYVDEPVKNRNRIIKGGH